jgi:hypothetical protein
MKKLLILIICLVIGFGLGYYFTKENKKKEKEKSDALAFIITDVSKNCLSNGIHVYYNDKYEVYKAFYVDGEKMKPIRTGNYNYDINKIIDNIDSYTKDNDTYMNYNIKIKDDNHVVAMQGNKELREFMDSIDGDKLLWCE